MAEILLPHRHGEDDIILYSAEQLSELRDFDAVAAVFRLMGDASRVRIFWLLCHCEECVLNISALVGMSSPAVSHHLRELKNSGLIESRREGKEVHYRAADTEEARLLHRMIENVMQISCPREKQRELERDAAEESAKAQQCRAEYVEIVKKIHRQLLENLDQRITIEELSRRYSVNTSTLKAVFKTVYGDSIASHMKRHRMEEAARLLVSTGESAAEIAKKVGYENQSKFTAAFRETYGVSPTAYRKENGG